MGVDPDGIAESFIHGLLYFLPMFGVALVTGAFWDALFARLRGRAPDDGLLYVAWFLALLMPASAPLYQVALGMTFGMVVGKLIYGGSGRYLVNPALLGMGFLMFSYPALLLGQGAWVPVPGWDNPTVLELVTDEGGLPVVASVGYDWWLLFIGDKPGTIGTVSPLGALLGAMILVWTGVASWRIMVGAGVGLIATALVFNMLTPANDLSAIPGYWQLVLGGFMFGTVFIATDPVTTPMTDAGRWGFGLLVGGLTMLVRVGNPAYYEGVMFAILLACLFSPLIDYVVVQRNIKRRMARLREGADG
jgi:Na+-transporting NADH:ubiquinone oxidoreductase subunit B